MDYYLDINGFSGPFDLLLDLIKKRQLDIYDIFISDVIDEFISEMKSMGLDKLSEFIYVASTLLEIKSKSLLPEHYIDDIEEFSNQKNELIEKLAIYKIYKDASLYLMDLSDEYNKKFYKYKDNYQIYFDEPEIYDINKNMDINLLVDAINNVLIKVNRYNRNTIFFDALKRDKYLIDDKMNSILISLKNNEKIVFESLFIDYVRIEVITVFLALLELIKLQKINVIQKSVYGNIFIVRGKNYE